MGVGGGTVRKAWPRSSHGILCVGGRVGGEVTGDTGCRRWVKCWGGVFQTG